MRRGILTGGDGVTFPALRGVGVELEKQAMPRRHDKRNLLGAECRSLCPIDAVGKMPNDFHQNRWRTPLVQMRFGARRGCALVIAVTRLTLSHPLGLVDESIRF